MSALLSATAQHTGTERLVGELDAVTGPEVRHRLLTWQFADATTLEVDLTQVTDMDAAGLSAIVMARRELRRNGIELVLVGTITPPVRRTLAVTRFARLFDLSETA